MKKFLSIVLALAMLLCCAAAVCAEEFVVNACIDSEPLTIDPSFLYTGDSASAYTLHQFENLMKYVPSDKPADESGNVYLTELALGQAASYEVSEDLLTYTFTLRDDIYWSDGQPVTANDFVYAWRRYVDSNGGYGFLLEGIVLNASSILYENLPKENLGIAALDDKTLQITLEAPCAYFLEVCASPYLVPLREDIVEGNANWTDPAAIIVNGPYKLSEWVHESYLKFVKNEQYYDAANLGPDAIVYWLSDSPEAVLSAYQSGEYQFVENYPTDMIESLQASGDAWVDPDACTDLLYLSNIAIPDWRVRAAMALSLDRKNLIENVVWGSSVPAAGYVSHGILDSTGANFAEGFSELGAMYTWLQEQYPDYDLSSYDGCCELAKVLYQAAVDEGAWDPNTSVVFSSRANIHKLIGEACAENWLEVLGLNTVLEDPGWAFMYNLGEGAAGAARTSWTADFNDPAVFLENMTTDSINNFGKFSNAEYDAKITEAKALPAGEERDALLYAAEKQLFAEGGFPVIPLRYYNSTYLNKTVKNIGYTPLGYYFFQYAQPVD